MRQRFFLRPALAAAAGAYAQDEPGWREGRWQTDRAQAPRRDYPPQDDALRYDEAPPYDDASRYDDYAPVAAAPLPNPGREAWLADCRQRVSSSDRGVGGAAIGGLVGGVAGNRIAGRGNRAVGTLAGAAVGAAAGVAIDRAEDSGRSRDACEAYLDDYYARYQGGHDGRGYVAAAPAYGYSQGYAYGCCGAAPVMMVPVQAQPECTETIEYVYEDVPVVRQKTYRPARRTKIVRDKRVKLSVK
jgi:uncharacterized protein YcfJ